MIDELPLVFLFSTGIMIGCFIHMLYDRKFTLSHETPTAVMLVFKEISRAIADGKISPGEIIVICRAILKTIQTIEPKNKS